MMNIWGLKLKVRIDAGVKLRIFKKIPRISQEYCKKWKKVEIITGIKCQNIGKNIQKYFKNTCQKFAGILEEK